MKLGKGKWYIFLGLLLACINTHGFQNEVKIKMRNLKSQSYTERFSVNQLIETTYKEAKKEDAYQLSMPLIASALQGNEKLYQEILPKMLEALTTIPTEKNSKKAWLLGRVLLAANNIEDKLTSDRTEAELYKLLTEENISKDAFFTWALGYLASSNEDEYKKFKTAMISSASALTNQYQTEKTKELSTDAIWAWVMALQAAANAGDKETFNFISEQMKQMTEQSSLSSALSQGLTPNDYPAWAFAIVRFAAATIGDKDVYDELEQPLYNSLETAKKTGNKTEEMLAQLNSQLAIAQWEQRQRNEAPIQHLVH